MQQLDNKTRAALVRNYYQNGNSASVGLRKFKTENGLIKDPCSVSTITRLVDKFESFGCICDLPRSGRPSFSVETVTMVESELKQQQSSSSLHIASVRSVAENVELHPSSVHKILRAHLHLKPYHIKHLQSLNESDFHDRLDFAHWFLEKSANAGVFLENIMWTDEAHFYLNGQLTTRNCVIWEKENPHRFTTTPLHSPKVTVWCGFTAKHMLPPFFFTSTVDGAGYLQMLETHMKPNLPRTFNNITFQQDGAPPHIANPVRMFLTQTFGDRVISRLFPQKWPPRSPDLNPADYWLWGYLKHKVYGRQPKNLQDLKLFIEEELRAIKKSMMRSAVFNILDRLNMVLQLNGGHIEHMF
jgi:hypothetical protein